MFGALPTPRLSRSLSFDSASILEKDKRLDLNQQTSWFLGATATRATRAHAAFLIILWIVTSNATILTNAYILNTLQFPYPTTLTTIHLLSFTLFTQLLARYSRTQHLLASRHAFSMTGKTYLRVIVPIGMLYAGSLVCSNTAYLTLGVGFIQMLKSLGPAAVLFASVSLRLQTLTVPLAMNVAVIVFGVMLAAVGEMRFVWSGFWWQMGGLLCEAYRLGLIEKLLGKKQDDDQERVGKMDPLVSLYYFAPVCAVMTGMMALVLEVPSISLEDWHRVGPGVLIGSAVVAFSLNLASLMVIGATSGLTLTVCGVLKNALLVVGSVVVWREVMTGMQAVGYAIATVGLLYYSLGNEMVNAVVKEHLLSAFKEGTSRDEIWTAQTSGLLRAVVRRNIAFVLLAVIGAVVLLLGLATGFRGPWLFDQPASEMTFDQANAMAQRMQVELKRYWESQVKQGKLPIVI